MQLIEKVFPSRIDNQRAIASVSSSSARCTSRPSTRSSNASTKPAPIPRILCRPEISEAATPWTERWPGRKRGSGLFELPRPPPSKPRLGQARERDLPAGSVSQRLRLLFLSVRVTDDWAHAGSPRLPFHKLYQTLPMFSGRESPQSLPHRARGRRSGTVPSPADHDGYPVQRWVRQRESRSDDWPKLGQRQLAAAVRLTAWLCCDRGGLQLQVHSRVRRLASVPGRR